MKKYLLSLAVICLFTTAQAQNLFVKVGATYGVSAADQKKRVSDKYAAGQDTVSTGLYYAWQRWKAEGMPYATFRSRYLGCAIAKDIAWRYEAASNIKSGYQNTFAFADWTDACGHWYANATMQIPRGGMVGQASFGYYDNTATSQIFATIEFQMTEDWWPANATERRLFETPNSSLGTPDNGSYNESFRIEGFRLTGPAVYGDGITRIGIYIRRPGECSYMNQVFAQMFQYGIMVVGGVPFTFGTLTAFWNEKVGVALMGGWGATFSGQTISGDSNGELFGAHPGYGDEGGGIISFNLGKNEDGILAESAQAPWRGQITAYLEGQYTANIGVSACSRNWITTDAAFVVNPRLTNGTPQASVLHVGPTKGFNFRTALQNLAAGTRYAQPGDYQGFTFTHYAQGDRMVMNDLPVTGTACNCPPLGFFRGNGTFDYVACTPARTGTVTPPPTGTWTCGAWSTCTAGSQSRTCTCTGTGCPSPATRTESQTCTVTPPSSTMTATSNPTPMQGSDGNPPVVRPLSASVDGNTGSYWLSGRSMEVGQFVTLDLGMVRTVGEVSWPVAPGYTNSYPRTFDVATYTTAGATPTPRVTSKAGGQNSIGTWTPTPVRFIQITVKTRNDNWLGVSEFTVK